MPLWNHRKSLNVRNRAILVDPGFATDDIGACSNGATFVDARFLGSAWVRIVVVRLKRKWWYACGLKEILGDWLLAFASLYF